MHSIHDIHSIRDIFEFLRHIDENFQPHGFYGYFVPFLVLFAETGFVVTPFLPGDTLLFAVGLLARPDRHALNIYILLPLLTLAPLCGDSTNFLIGRWFGHRMFSNPNSKIFRRSALERTHEFFEKHGERTIILARWVAIVRTFAPFVAGMGEMKFARFIRFSAIGAFFWVWGCMLAGYFFGALRVVRENFGWAMLAMLLAGAIPISIEILKQRQEVKERQAQEAQALAVLDDEGSPLPEA